MLSNNQTSSIAQRRQQHRRQQSLEVPIIAQPLPVNQRHRNSVRPGHRRGLSLEHGSTGFRSLHNQEHNQFQQPTHLANMAINTNLGQPYPLSDTQHYVQDTQQLFTSQPGFPAQDFQTHLQQQLQGLAAANPQQPQPSTARDAKMQLQEHIEWFQTTYGESAPSITISTSPNTLQPSNVATMSFASPSNQPLGLAIQDNHMGSNQFGHGVAQMTHAHPHTVPNTPQQPWSSPPQPQPKHIRSQSFQLDTAPMPATFDAAGGDFVLMGGSFNNSQNGFSQDNFASFGGEQSYPSSAYSSSIADPASPHAFNTPHMPTVLEEPDLPGMEGAHFQQPYMGEPHHLLDVTAGAHSSEDDHFLYHPHAMSPRSAAMATLGGINASIEETGVSPEEVNQYMSEQDPKDNKWSCMFPECNKRFGRKENIRAHVQTHLGDRQFKCNDCGKCFVRQHDLKRHAKIHSGVKNHVCPCGMSFARQDALTRHRQRGMCFGVLPGFEKQEEDRKKRGRPRKERPDSEARVEKATRARRMDAANAAHDRADFNARINRDNAADDILAAADDHYGSASSDSGASECSFPVTPPDTQSDMFEDLNFADYVDPAVTMGGDVFDFSSGSAGSSWRADTPPTSPPVDYSSPLDSLSFPANYDVAEGDLRSDLMSYLQVS
jgi:regulatory protein SWI5